MIKKTNTAKCDNEPQKKPDEEQQPTKRETGEYMNNDSLLRRKLKMKLPVAVMPLPMHMPLHGYHGMPLRY